MVENVGIIITSDTCSVDTKKDTSGPALTDLIKQMFPNAEIRLAIIPDDLDAIQKKLIHFCDDLKVDLILTSGGTGLSKRDVTPEATRAVIHRDVPGIATSITMNSLKITPMAMLSRAIAGIRNKTLIINFPGSKKAVIECFNIVKPVLSHAVSLIKSELNEVQSTHRVIQGLGDIAICPHAVNSNIDTSQVAFRLRESPYPMIEMSKAYQIVDEMIKQWKPIVLTQWLGTEEALGRVTAANIHAKEPLPPFAASIKDGYACLSTDGAGVRRVRTALAAGDEPNTPLAPGECARINTGAAIPPGADCVVQVEDTRLKSASDDGKIEYEVEILVAPTPKQDIRPIGADIQPDEILAPKGAILDAALVGVLAGAGVQNVIVFNRPDVALLSTGNELQEPTDVELTPAHVRDSNRMMLRCLLKEHGFESIDCGIARDESAELVNAISRALTKADILVCTGGVSMGEKDLLKPVLLNHFGATIHFGRVKMKPGKPSTFATCNFNGRIKFIFALPGNPVSAYVCCLLFVVRALRICMGRRGEWVSLRVRLGHGVTLDPRPEYARATLQQDRDPPLATLIGSQASSRLLSACGATVLLALPPSGEQLSLPAGTLVTALITSRLN